MAISEAAASISATISWIRVRTMRFFNRASVVGPVQTVFRFAPRRASAAVSIAGAGKRPHAP